MTFESLHSQIVRQSFKPFRLFLTDGTQYDIRHPELLMLGRREVIVGLASKPDQSYFDRFTFIDLLHVIRTEELPASIPQNGEVPSS